MTEKLDYDKIAWAGKVKEEYDELRTAKDKTKERPFLHLRIGEYMIARAIIEVAQNV